VSATADVCGPGAGYVIPLVMRKKFIGETASKVVCLAHIYRMPMIAGRLAENVDAAYGVKRNAINGEVLKFVPRTTGPSPNDDGARAD
jgi:hypothetical protein